MTKQELNRDIKRLRTTYLKAVAAANWDDSYQVSVYDEIKPEFLRLYRADQNAEYMNYASFRFMHRLNLIHRFVDLHLFMIQVDI
tara:strand:- start:63 stop:317 length:255 start_codon:yes stop_codon:yes gene_type:complete